MLSDWEEVMKYTTRHRALDDIKASIEGEAVAHLQIIIVK